MPRRPPFLLRLLCAFFSVSLFSLPSFLFPVFLSRFSFPGFPFSISLHSSPFLFFLGCSAFCFDFRFSCSALPRGSAWARDRASWLALPGRRNLSRAGRALPMRAARAKPCAAPRGLFCFSPSRVEPAVGARRARIRFSGAPPGSSDPDGRSNRCGRPHGSAKRGFAQQNAGRSAAQPARRAQDVLKMSWKVDAGGDESRPKRTGPKVERGRNGRRRANARGEKKERKREEMRGKKRKRKGKERKRESMREVLTSKKTTLNHGATASSAVALRRLEEKQSGPSKAD